LSRPKHLVIDHIQSAIDADPNVHIMQCCKSFTIYYALIFIKGEMNKFKPESEKLLLEELIE
jgi:hypothetical protein